MSFYNTIFEEPTEGTPGPPGVSVDDIVYNDPEDQIDFILSNGIVKEIPFPGISLDTTAKIHLHGANDPDKFKITNESGSIVLKVSTSEETEGIANFVQAPFLFVADNFDGVNLNEMENGMLYVYGEGNFAGSSVEFAKLDFTEGRQTAYFKAYHQDERIEIMGSGRSDKFVITSELENEALKVDTTGKGAVVAPTVRIGEVDETDPENIVGTGFLEVYGETSFRGNVNAKLSIECPSRVSSIFRAVKFIVDPPLIDERVFFELDPDTQKVSITGDNNSSKFQVSNVSGSSIFTVDTVDSQVKTKYNTLDNGSGAMTVYGNVSITGDNNSSKFQVSNVSGSSIFTVDTTASQVKSKYNTLDNGFGGMTIAGNVSINGLNHLAKFRIITNEGISLFTVDTVTGPVKTRTNILDYGDAGGKATIAGISLIDDGGGKLIENVSGYMTLSSLGQNLIVRLKQGVGTNSIDFGTVLYGAPSYGGWSHYFSLHMGQKAFLPARTDLTLGTVSNTWAKVWAEDIEMNGNLKVGATGDFSGDLKVSGVVLANSIQPANTGHISIMTNDSEALNFGQMKSGVPTIYASFGSAGGFIPGSSNPTKNLGWVDNRWSNVYCGNIDMTGNISMPNITSKITTPRINGISGSYLFIDAAEGQAVSLRVNATGGVVALENIFRPSSNNTTDLGGVSIAWKNIRLNGSILSNISGVSNIGSSSLPFNNIYATNTAIQTSDANKKNTIVNSDLGLDFIEALRPVSYKMNDGTSGRTHYGLISQEVEEILPDFEKTTQDFAGFIKSPRTDIEGNVVPDQFDYALRYGEFIAPMIKAIQELSAQNAALTARIESLEEQMSEL